MVYAFISLIGVQYKIYKIVVIFLGDEIRRLVTESFIPLITEKISSYQQKNTNRWHG